MYLVKTELLVAALPPTNPYYRREFCLWVVLDKTGYVVKYTPDPFGRIWKNGFVSPVSMPSEERDAAQMSEEDAIALAATLLPTLRGRHGETAEEFQARYERGEIV